MRRQDVPPNTQTIASLHANGCRLQGSCACGRFIRVDMAELIALVGGETLVTAAAQRISCKDCGARVEMQVVPVNAPGR